MPKVQFTSTVVYDGIKYLAGETYSVDKKAVNSLKPFGKVVGGDKPAPKKADKKVKTKDIKGAKNTAMTPDEVKTK